MKKIILAILIIIILAALLAAGIWLVSRDGDNEIEPTPEPTPTETTQYTPTPTPEPPPVETPEPTPNETPEPTIDNEPPNIDHELVGTWQYFDNWDNVTRDIMVLNADATGNHWAINPDWTLEFVDVTWESENGILTIFMPSGEIWELEYVVRGDTLSLTGVDGHETLTRAE